ncbi:hypothetical protein AB6A40_011521 [Gnathostoma spinigerum]|uniref:Uncharacterized protein n=1 Tax=Gnathostoma spinigerum TaxID=75299 RepID=A0ABD6F456_9BILA
MIERECRKLNLQSRRKHKSVSPTNTEHCAILGYHSHDIVKENRRLCMSKKYRSKSAPRKVPAFTVQSLQRNTFTGAPKLINDRPKDSDWDGQSKIFRLLSDRGDLPVRIDHDRVTNKYGRSIKWMIPPAKLTDDDFQVYLLNFFSGLALLEQVNTTGDLTSVSLRYKMTMPFSSASLQIRNDEEFFRILNSNE